MDDTELWKDRKKAADTIFLIKDDCIKRLSEEQQKLRRFAASVPVKLMMKMQRPNLRQVSYNSNMARLEWKTPAETETLVECRHMCKSALKLGDAIQTPPPTCLSDVQINTGIKMMMANPVPGTRLRLTSHTDRFHLEARFSASESQTESGVSNR